jgi:hypothetical protein
MITGAAAAGFGVYTLQVPVRALLRHFYQLGNSRYKLNIGSDCLSSSAGSILTLRNAPGVEPSRPNRRGD